MNPLVVESCDYMYSIIKKKINHILNPLRGLKRRIEEEEYVDIMNHDFSQYSVQRT